MRPSRRTGVWRVVPRIALAVPSRFRPEFDCRRHPGTRMNRTLTNCFPLLLNPTRFTTAPRLPLIEAPAAIVPYRQSAPHAGIHPWRVTLFIDNLRNGSGAERPSIELARSLKSRGWNVSIVAMLFPEYEATLLGSERIPLYTLDAGGGNPVRLMLRLARFLKAESPHILHCHTSRAVLISRLARLSEHVPVVIGTLHGLDLPNVNRTGVGTPNRHTDWSSDVTTVACKAAADRCLSSGSVTRRTLRLIPNGVNSERFRFDPAARLRLRTELDVANEFVWLALGRSQSVEDLDFMIRAFARVAAQAPRSILLFADRGPLRRELAELAQGMGVASRLKFFEPQSDVQDFMSQDLMSQDLMSAADAGVLSSSYEAMPMELLEAAATGLPSVTVNAGSASEIVVHGVTGFLAPPFNPEEMANAMLRLWSLPAASRTLMGEQARCHVTSRFALSQVTGQWESLYREMLARKEVRL
jgi:glycosyltransferase involved in cell wall biosynthesis